jgi:hypothetical protein
MTLVFRETDAMSIGDSERGLIRATLIVAILMIG